MAVKKENRGGKREGAGRKPLLELAGQTRQDIIKQVIQIAEDNDTSFGEVLGNMIFAKRGEKRVKMQAMQLFVRDVLPKVAEQEVTKTSIVKPEIYMPEEMPDSDEAPAYTPTQH